MRKLVWFTLGFGAACGLCCWGMPATWILPLAIAAAITALLTCLLSPKRLRFPVLLVCIGCLLGLGWFRLYYSSYLLPLSGMDATEQPLVITVTDYSRSARYGICVDGRTELAGKHCRIRVYLNETRELEPGDRIYGTFRLRLTTGSGAGEATYHRGNGLFVMGYDTGGAAVYPGQKPRGLGYPAVLAREIGRTVEAFFPEDTGPFAKALLLGDTDGLDYAHNTHLKLSGIRHVVAVSGLHVSILFTLLCTLVRRRRFLLAIVGLPVLALFAAIAGFSPSVTRACLMCGLMLLAMVARRDYDGPTALAFSCLVMLLHNPLVTVSAAFQLSVGAVAGIYLFQKPLQTWFLSYMGDSRGKTVSHRLKRWLAGSVAVSLSATAFTTALSAMYFGTVSLVSILTNLLTLWVISFIFYGIMGVCLLSLICTPAALLLAKVCSVGIRYVLGVSRVMGSLPVCAVFTGSVYVVIWLVFCYVLLLFFLWEKNRKPVIGICCAVVGLCVALTASWLEPVTDELRMTVLDVGQGQSILLQWSGKTFLVDCGGDSDTQTADLVAQNLLCQGVSRLDGIVVTHSDWDHLGALDNLLTRVGTDRLLFPCSGGEERADARYLEPGECLSFSAEGGTLTVFGPISRSGGNENSLCVLFQKENCAILITGDRSGFGERMLLRSYSIPQVDVLIAGHHGSATSVCRELLDAVKPKIVLISAGEQHPVPVSLLRTLEEYDCQVFRTAASGTLVYRR